MRMAYRSQGRRQGMMRFDKAYFEGYLTEGTNLKAYIYADYQGSTSLQDVVINNIENPARLFIGIVASSIGLRTIGDLPLGDGIIPEGGEQEMVPKFRKINRLSLANCFEYDIAVYSSEVNSRWEILALGVNATQAPEQAVFLSR